MITALLLAGFGVLHALAATQSWVGRWMQLCSGVFAVGYFATAVLMWRRAFWARWLTQGIAVVGLLNCGAFFVLWQAGKLAGAAPVLIGAQAAGFVALLALTAGRSMRGAFDEKPSAHNRWRYDSGAVKALRLAVVLNFAALPMLFKYIGSAANPTLVATACGVLAIALALVILQRTAGILMLAVAGVMTAYVAFVAGGALMHMMSFDPRGVCGFAFARHSYRMVETAMMSAGFVPGAVAALAALAVFTAPMARFVRRGR